MKTVAVPCVEVHISDISAREGYRAHTYTGEAAVAVIAGKGFDGYIEAMDILKKMDR